MLQLLTSPEPLEAQKDSGGLIGYLAVFGNVDREGDVIQPGAFKASLVELGAGPNGELPPGKVPLLSRHLASGADAGSVVGSITLAREDTHGLFIEAEFANDEDSQEMRRKVLDGHIKYLSVGYITRKSAPLRGGYRSLLDLELLEGSLVPVPANPDAVILAGKGLEKKDETPDPGTLSRVRKAFRRVKLWRLLQ